MKQLVSRSCVSLCESNTDVSRLSILGVLLLLAEFFLGGGRTTRLLVRLSGYRQVWLCFLLFGIFGVVVATALASLFAMLLRRVLSPFPLRIYLETALVSAFYAACFYVCYRLLCVELLGGHWRAFSQYHWGVLEDMLLDWVSGKPLTQVGPYFDTSLRGFLVRRYPFFLTAFVYLLWCLNRGTLLPKFTIVVFAYSDEMLDKAMEEAALEEMDEEEMEEEEKKDSDDEKSGGHGTGKKEEDSQDDEDDDDNDDDEDDDFDPDLEDFFRWHARKRKKASA